MSKKPSDIQKAKQDIQRDLQSSTRGQGFQSGTFGAPSSSEAQKIRQEIQNDIQSSSAQGQPSSVMGSALSSANPSEAQKIKQDIQRDLNS